MTIKNLSLRHRPRVKALGRESFTSEQIEEHSPHLAKHHLDVLRLALTLQYEHIAEKLELPVGTVKSRLYRARIALQKRVKLARDQAEQKLRQEEAHG